MRLVSCSGYSDWSLVLGIWSFPKPVAVFGFFSTFLAHKSSFHLSRFHGADQHARSERSKTNNSALNEES